MEALTVSSLIPARLSSPNLCLRFFRQDKKQLQLLQLSLIISIPGSSLYCYVYGSARGIRRSVSARRRVLLQNRECNML